MNLLWTAFIMGLATSAHCLVMCGPLVLGMAGSAAGGKLLIRSLLHQAGRLSAYVGIGVLFGLLGEVISLTAYQQSISIGAGVLLLIALLLRGRMPSVMKVWTGISSKFFRQIRQYPHNISTYLGGVLNGLLPCGMVYLAATASLHQGSLTYSMSYMLLFGLGTLPAMLGVQLLGRVIRFRWRQALSKAVPYMLAGMALLFIMRGMALGIPYVSPKVTIEKTGAVKSCCSARHH